MATGASCQTARCLGQRILLHVQIGCKGMVCEAKDGMMYAANMGVRFPAGNDGCNMCTCAPSPAVGYEAMLICGTKTCPSCPLDEAPMQCKYDPCLDAECPVYPRATCNIDNCGKCAASFELDGRKVDCFKAPDPFHVANAFRDEEFKKCSVELDGTSNCTEGMCIVNSNDFPRHGICILPLQSQVCLGKDGVFYAAGRGVSFPAGDGCNFCTCEPPSGAGLPAIMQCSTKPCAICPLDKPPVQCLVDPCLDKPKCDLFPEAECMPYNCAKCTHMFFVNSERVDCHNAKSILKCKDSSTAKDCVNPCLKECLAFPNATCKPSYCGGCQAVFSVEDVILNCTEAEAAEVQRESTPGVDCHCDPEETETESHWVCGADGKNYTSICLARCAGVSFNNGPCLRGECQPNCAEHCGGDDGCGGLCDPPHGNDCSNCCLQDSLFRSTYAPGGVLDCYQWCLSRSDSFFGYLDHKAFPLPKGVRIPGEAVESPPEK